jgi:hypothetical protein
MDQAKITISSGDVSRLNASCLVPKNYPKVSKIFLVHDRILATSGAPF